MGTAITVAFLIATERAPTGRQTEAYALLSLTLNGGAALGGFLAGQAVAHGSAKAGFLVVVACGLLATILHVVPMVGGRIGR